MAIYDAEYRRMAKAANQRLLTFERAGMNSPAVLRAKAQLSMMGRNRFTETGKGETQAAIESQKRFLQKFLYGDQTSTKKGYKSYRQAVIDTAKEKYGLEESGVSDEDYLSMWESLDDDKTKRAYGSEVYIAILKTAERKFGKDNMPDIKGMFEKVEAAKTYKGALKAIGLTPSEVNETLRSMNEE